MGDLVTTEQSAPPAQNSADSSRAGDNVRSSDVLIQLVTFQLVGEEFGLPILDVREIIRMTEITPVPQAPNFVEGVINLRGQIVPIVDLRKRFSLACKDNDENSRIIVVDINKNLLGLIVDGVSEVLRIPADTISSPPKMVANGIGSEYIKGIGHYNEMLIILIDLKKVFNTDELNTLGDME